jgi:hypothetical protein
VTAPLAFIHLPRTAGRSIIQAIREAYGRHRTYAFDLRRAPRREEAERIPDGVEVIYGHMAYGLHRHRPVRYATVIREPIARTLSHFRLFCFKRPTIAPDELVEPFLAGKWAANAQTRLLAGVLGQRREPPIDEALEMALWHIQGFYRVEPFDRLDRFARGLGLGDLPHVVESRERAVPPGLMDELIRRNAADAALYRQVLEMN